jgi:hypothetical protein
MTVEGGMTGRRMAVERWKAASRRDGGARRQDGQKDGGGKRHAGRDGDGRRQDGGMVVQGGMTGRRLPVYTGRDGDDDKSQ